MRTDEVSSVGMSWNAEFPCGLLWMAPGQMACHHVAIACVIYFQFHFEFLVASF
jgi:hypothetical protein